MRRWVLDTAQGQIIAILVGALATTLTLAATLLILARPAVPPMPAGPWPGALQIVAVIEALHAAPAEARQPIAKAVSTDNLEVHVGPPAACVRAAPTNGSNALQLILGNLLGDRLGAMSVAHCAGGAGIADWTQVELPLAEDTLSVRTRMQLGFPQIVLATLPLTVAISFLLVLVIALSLWTLWRVNRPLRRLASGVENFGLDAVVTPLSERGPVEIRQVAGAFNRMQERIMRSNEDRTRMLMAIGHDLRTPLTRLKLRVELDGAITTRQSLLKDLDLMHKMINGALSYLMVHSDNEAPELIDIGALVESICIEFAAGGKRVGFSGSYGLGCRCQPTAFIRAISNLLENGCRYGTNVQVSAARVGPQAVIEVRDDGPGIPASELEAVLRPFVRLDTARPVVGGLGLGLSIVQDIVSRHRGRLILSNGEPSGLVVRVLLPLDECDQLAQPAPAPASF